jgi:hypothetical protein
LGLLYLGLWLQLCFWFLLYCVGLFCGYIRLFARVIMGYSSYFFLLLRFLLVGCLRFWFIIGFISIEIKFLWLALYLCLWFTLFFYFAYLFLLFFRLFFNLFLFLFHLYFLYLYFLIFHSLFYFYTIFLCLRLLQP